MNQKSSARPPDHGILKKELFGYTGICLVLILLLGTGERMFDTFPVKAMLSALCYLVVGGLGMSAGMFCFRPEAERSEFFKTFTLLYHPGVWMIQQRKGLKKLWRKQESLRCASQKTCIWFILPDGAFWWQA